MAKKLKIKKKKVLKVTKEETPVTENKCTDLREVMDYDRPFRMIYSGVENEQYFNLLYDMGIRDFLMSYHYIKEKHMNMSRYKGKNVKFLIDSGAHTYQNDLKYQDYDIEYWENHLRNYLNWAKKNREYIYAIVSFDFENLVGADVVSKWYNQYFEPFMLETGIPVCFVWHQNSSMSWEQYCQRYPYVGFSSVNTEGVAIDLQEYIAKLNIASKYNTLVHGFGMTRTAMLTKVPFYTSDSSVDGKSSVLVKDCDNTIMRINIEDLYKLVEKWAIQTTPTEMRAFTEKRGYKVLTVDDNNKMIWGDLNAVVKHTVKKPTVKLGIEGNKEIICTTDHSIIGMNKQGDLIEVKADSLHEGDYVLSPRKFSLENPVTELVEVIIQKPGFSKERTELQMVEVSDIYLQFLGLWVGDGCYYSNAPGDLAFACYQDKECKEVIDTICNLYKAKPSVQPNGIDVKISNVRMRRIMEALEFTGNSYTKRIPSFIFSLHENQICKFLQGYFSADGTGTCECSTVSEGLKDDLVELLNALGINVSVSYRTPRKFVKDDKEYNASGIWHLSIRDGESKLLFQERIGFLQDYKNKKLAETINLNPNIRGARRRCIPKELAITPTIKTNDSRSVSVESFKGRISRKYGNGFNDKVLNSEVDFLRINSIEWVTDGTEEVTVYDLSVDKYERFIANGILVHNTTWLVGLQYGEVNYWTGTKMTRLKKEKWKGEYLSKLVDLGLDEQKLLDEDTAELIKANIKAFLEAQKYIDTKLRPRMYWLKPKSQVQSVSDINFPDPAWLRLEAPTDATDWAKKLNINPELPLADLMVMIQDATIFINWDDDKYADFRDEFYNDDYIHQAHTLWVNTVVTDNKQKVKDLCEFFTECVEGKNDKLLVYGTGFDRQAKERDHYMEEEEYDYEDMTEDELQYVLANSGLLPEPKEDGTAPEIDELDDEIFKDLDIVPVRDEKGRFLKGQKAVRKPKKVYSKKYPKLFCDTCYSAQTCPEYKQGMVCAFKKMFNRFDTRNQEDVMDAMASMVEMNLDRLQRASIFEMLDGGLPNNIVTNLISQNMQMLNQMANLNLNLPKEVIKQTHTVRSDGSRETVTQVSNAGASGGILAELFKDMKSATEDNDDDVQDIMAEKEKSDKEDAIEVEGKEVKE